MMINKTIGKYKITRLIGEGGMASVFEAEHEMLGTKVAIKVLNPLLSGNAQIKERFRNEAKLMASLDHPNIAKMIDFDEQPHQLSIIMEYLNGEDLNEKIKRNGSLSENEVITFFKQILSAFQYAHERGIVHRDIKPSNIFILPDGRVKILDFGIAKLFGQGNEMTQTGTQMGTPIYMSPEQVKADKSIDHRSDIYSLGVTMFYAVNGKPPYNSDIESQFDIFSKIVYEPLPELIDFSKLDQFIKKACDKNREQRFQSCDEWLNGLQSFSPDNDLKKELKNSNSTSKDDQNQKQLPSQSLKSANETNNINSPGLRIRPESLKQRKKWVIIIIAVVVFFSTIFFTFLIAFFFVLFGENDSDNDGIQDEVDACIYIKGDPKGKGCPDSDDDGIYDNKDACPEEFGNNEDGCFYYRKVTFENNSKNPAFICIAYMHDNVWTVNGHFYYEPGEKNSIDLPEKFSSSEIYWYARDAISNDEWVGSDKYFTIDDHEAFKLVNGEFTTGGANAVRKGFYLLPLTEENTTQSFTD